VALDVNSGNFRPDQQRRGNRLSDEPHAAKEIARQLRLRDLGGVIRHTISSTCANEENTAAAWSVPLL